MQLITPADAAGRVTAALKSAAAATGAGFDYLLSTAKRESSLNPAAQAGTSSARGLFQFIDQTWLEVLKEEGPRLGLADAAASVTRTSAGKYVVSDPAKRAEILALRDDPQASALLAGAFTQRNAAAFSGAVGRAPSQGELYAAHFLGAQGAVALTRLASMSPDAPAAESFPSQAAANRAIFFDKERARSVAEVYARLTQAPKGDATASTGAAPSFAVAAARSTAEPEVAAYNGGVENDRAAFHSMFKTGRRSPVSAYVAQAWSAFGEAGMAADMKPGEPRRVAATAVPDVARAYAPVAEAAPAPAAARTAAAEASAAVTEAARSTKRRTAASKAAAATAQAAQPQAAAAKATPATTASIPIPEPRSVELKPATRERFDLGDYLLSALTGKSKSVPPKAGAQ